MINGFCCPFTVTVMVTGSPPSIVPVTVAVPAATAVISPVVSFTVAISALSTLHRTSAFGGFVVYCGVHVWPGCRLTFAFCRIICFFGSFTFTVQLTVFPFSTDAVMVVVPAFLVVITPFATSATSLLLLSQVIFASCGVTDHFKVAVSPVSRFNSSWINIISEDPPWLGTTCTLHVTLLPSSTAAVITASPTVLAVITPFATDATASLLVLQFTTVPAGFTDHFRLRLPPTCRFTSTSVNVISGFVEMTFTSQDAVLPPFTDAVIMAVPALTAVTLPSATVATLLLLLLQVTGVPAGVTVQVSSFTAPSCRLIFSSVNLTSGAVGRSAAVTSTAHVPISLLPSNATALILALPTPTAVTLPVLESTTATCWLSLSQRMAYLSLFSSVTTVPSINVTSASKVALSPTFNDFSDGVTLMVRM